MMADDISTSSVSPTEPTPALATTSSSTESSKGNVAVAVATVGRPTPSPDLLLLLPQPLSSSNYDSESPHADHNLEISGQPSSSQSDTNADTEAFISTPSPFKKQKSALAGSNAIDDKSWTKKSSDVIEYGPTQLRGKTHEDCVQESLSESNFQGDHLLSGSLLQSPDPLLGNNDAGTIDFDFLGQEVIAAASTASAMLSRYDGFDPMPAYSAGSELFNDAASTSTTEPIDGLGVNLFSQYPYQDAFPLPPYLQVHLDVTHAESTAVAATTGYDGRSGTGESPRTGYDLTSAPGSTPPSVSFRSASTVRSCSEDNNVGSRGKTLEQLARAKQNVKNDKTRPRPLPLRKRKFIMNDSDNDEYQPPTTSELVKAPASKKRTLVRHNVRADGGDLITCKCSKSKCLKLYCDCFQQGKLCSPTECECKGCKNTHANSGPNGIRTKTIEEIILRRPDAFEPRTRDADEGCRCKKNRCLKKYCICFNQGIACDSKCRCKNCENQPGQNDTEEDHVPVKVEVKRQRVSKVHAETTSTRVVFDNSIYGEPPKLPGGYTYGYRSPSHLTPEAGETALV